MTVLTTFAALNCAIEINNSAAVDACIDTILQNPDLTNVLFYTQYSESLLLAIKNGNPDIFETMCSVQKSLTFDFNRSRLIVQQLATYDDVRLRQIFLSYVDNCDKDTQGLLVLSVYMQQYQNLIDDICDQELYADLRCLLARGAIEFNNIDMLWRIAQTTPQIIPNLSNLDPSTEKGRTWIEIHERYTVWQAQKEHEILTAEVSEVDNPVAVRKM